MYIDASEAARAAEAHGLSGIQMAVRSRDGDIQEWCAGRRNADGDPVTPDTLFAVGSIGKLLTVLSVAQACDVGLATLDGRIDEAGPQFRIGLDGVSEVSAPSLRLLLSNAGGIMDPLERMPDGLQEALVPLRRRGLLFAPGRTMAWSNAGFAVAGAYLEAVVGASFEEIARTAVLEPLDLRDFALMPNEVMHRRFANDHAGTSFAWMRRGWQVPAGLTAFANAANMVRLGAVFCTNAAPVDPPVLSAGLRDELARPTMRGVSGYSAAYEFCAMGKLAKYRILHVNGSAGHGYAELRVDLDSGEAVAGCSTSASVETFLSDLFPRFARPLMARSEFPEAGEATPSRPIVAYEGAYIGATHELVITVADQNRLELCERDRLGHRREKRFVAERVNDEVFLRSIAGGFVQPVRFLAPTLPGERELAHVDGHAFVKVTSSQVRTGGAKA